MVTWKEVSETQPELARKGEGLIFQYDVGLAFLATVRSDGAPRLHPVCPVLSNSGLYVFVMPFSPKLRDLTRDGRFALQTFPQPRPDSDEFYISGTARAVTDTAVSAAALADAKHHVSPDEVPFEFLIDRIMHTKWEGFGTPAFHPVHEKWRAPATSGTAAPNRT
ncbi:MAG TPA: pyridoxamine 5'-phosphate oxidase family protein [Anaerolineales bacterium]|nr:pyridoxamine 5'-phosphate oxidase family protein [Anaerolineales bacterium]